MGSGVARCPPAAQELAGGGEERRPHLGRWRLASRELRGQASGMRLRWGPGWGRPVWGGGSRGGLQWLSAWLRPRRHCWGARPGQSHSRHHCLPLHPDSEQVLGPWPAVLVERVGFREDVGPHSRGSEARLPKQGDSEAGTPRAGAQRPGPPRQVHRFQIPKGTYLPLQSINERKFLMIKMPSLKLCCRLPAATSVKPGLDSGLGHSQRPLPGASSQ